MIITQTVEVVYEARFVVRARDGWQPGSDWRDLPTSVVDFVMVEAAHAYLRQISLACAADFESAGNVSKLIAENVAPLSQNRKRWIDAYIASVDGVYEVVTTQRKLDSPDDALPLYSGLEPMISTKSRPEK